MEILIMIYFAINIFISGSILVYCMQDEESFFTTIRMIIVYALIGSAVALVVITGALIDMYLKKKKINKR